MNPKQQQFILRFCRQLASVIQACEHNESAEIELGRRHVGKHQVKVRLLAEREKGFAAPIGTHGSRGTTSGNKDDTSEGNDW
jgi:hypothetical protein